MGVGGWLRDHPRMLEAAYQLTHSIFQGLNPLFDRIGYQRVEAVLRTPEEWLKGLTFDCRMCGQCVLHSTGMTCPMTCPKKLRNGPCGGVRPGGYCEVKPEMQCVWVEAYERSGKMSIYGDEIRWLQPPVDQQLEGRSAWITMLTEEDQAYPVGWEGRETLEILAETDG